MSDSVRYRVSKQKLYYQVQIANIKLSFMKGSTYLILTQNGTV